MTLGDDGGAAHTFSHRSLAQAVQVRLAPRPRRPEHVPAQEDALEVRRRDVVAERGGVEVAQLGEREGVRCEREADVGVRELAAQALACGEHDLCVVERDRGEVVDDVPRRVGREHRVDVGGNEAEEGGRELPPARVPARSPHQPVGISNSA